jgi:DNA-binding transcriptional regulator YhcF (GntR family)
MSPTFKTERGYRFHIWSNEESRMHVHISKDDNAAKVWLEPIIEIAENKGFSEEELNKIIKIVSNNESEFKAKFSEHIG